MYHRRNLSEELKHQLKNGTMTNRLVIANLIVFLLIKIILAIGRLNNVDLMGLIEGIFSFSSYYPNCFTMPWGIFTSIFSHIELQHIIYNLILLYFTGKIFEQYFSGKKLLLVYILGGIIGNITQALSIYILNESNVHIIGASGSIAAVMFALAFYIPNQKILLFGLIPFRIIFIPLLLLITDLDGIGTDDKVAHFAHLGGAFFGFLAVKNINTSKNVIFQIERLQEKIKNLVKKKPEMYYTRSDQHKTDEQYNFDKRKKQEKTDLILDKISKSGYDSLTKEEKDFLFNQSKNG